MVFKHKKIPGLHQHNWFVAQENAIFSWSKRNSPLDVVYFRGKLWKCIGCGELRFRAAGLREVEVTSCHAIDL